jgi:DNA invertase Pin-like site-specific DNA recombinase
VTMIGYARVSTAGQTLATQKALLKKAGVDRIQAEKVSGVASKRPAFERVLDDLEAADTLVVTKLDRLVRSTLDLLRIIDRIGKAGASFRSLGDPWADTTSSHGRLMLTILGGIAEFERSLILQRTHGGRARALADGVRFGRKPKLTKHQAREALKRVAASESLRTIALTYAVDHSHRPTQGTACLTEPAGLSGLCTSVKLSLPA